METDVDVPRDTATGQFTGAEPLTGLPGLEADAGYRPLIAPNQTDEIDAPPSREEFGALVGDQPDDPDPIRWVKTDGSNEPLEENITTTLDQAAEALTAYQSDVGRYVEGAVLDSFVADVDAARAEALRSNPADANELGLDPAEVAKHAPKDEEPPTPADAPLKANDNSESVKDLDPDVERALKLPQVRQALEQEFSKADTAREQYSNALNLANQVSLARLAEIIPDVAGLPPEQRQQGLELLAQVDRPRFDQAMMEIKRVSDIQIAQQQQQHYRAVQQEQEFQNYKAQQDALFDQAVGKLSESDISAVRGYVSDVLGLTPEQASSLAKNPTVTDHRFQRALLDAARFHAMKSAAAPLPTRALPPVQRPGTTSPAPRGSDNASKIAALNAQLDSATSETQQLKIAARIMELRSASR